MNAFLGLKGLNKSAQGRAQRQRRAASPWVKIAKKSKP